MIATATNRVSLLRLELAAASEYLWRLARALQEAGQVQTSLTDDNVIEISIDQDGLRGDTLTVSILVLPPVRGASQSACSSLSSCSRGLPPCTPSELFRIAFAERLRPRHCTLLRVFTPSRLRVLGNHLM